MTILDIFPDVEDALVELLNGPGTAQTFLPADFKDHLPFHRIYRFAGSDDRITDRAVVGVDTFAATRNVGLPAAEQVRQRMLAAPHAITTDAGVVVIDTVSTAEGPHEVPWGDSGVRRWVSSYTVTLRR